MSRTDQSTGPELDPLVDTAVAAFLDDPLYRWLQPEPKDRERLLRENFRLTLAAGARNAELHRTHDGLAVAVPAGRVAAQSR